MTGGASIDERRAAAAAAAPAAAIGALLCTCNYPPNGGYAWTFIERVCGALADTVAARGIATWVAYPRVDAPPVALAGTAARPVALDVMGSSTRDFLRVLGWVRRHGVRTVYLSDRPAASWRYALLRAAGVRWVVAHMHAGGPMTRPRGLRRALKWVRARVSWLTADVVIGVSDYVAERERSVALMPASKVVRVWNAIDMPDAAAAPANRRAVRAELDIADGATVIAMASRASRLKGVEELIRAFDVVARETGLGRDRLRLVYVGGGVDFDAFAALVASLPSRGQITLTGPRPDARPYLDAADVVALPSYDEAFGLAALEGSACGKPVVATTVGGIPEIVRDGVEGLLVPPGDVGALAAALRRLVERPAEAAAMGARGRERAATEFGTARLVAEVAACVLRGWPTRR